MLNALMESTCITLMLTALVLITGYVSRSRRQESFAIRELERTRPERHPAAGADVRNLRFASQSGSASTDAA